MFIKRRTSKNIYLNYDMNYAVATEPVPVPNILPVKEPVMDPDAWFTI